MLSKIAALLVSVVCLVSTVVAQPPIQTPPTAAEADPDSVIQAFVKAINQNDFESAARLVQGGKKGEALEMARDEIQKARGAYTYEVKEVSFKFEGQMQDFATALIRLRLNDAIDNRITHDERVKMQQIGNGWRLVPLSGEAFIGLFQGFGGDSDLLERFASYLAHPEAVAKIRTSRCMGHLKLLGIAAIQFSQDWDEKFALKAQNYPEALHLYMRNDAILVCPLEDEGANSYAFNAKLENANFFKIKQPEQTVMFYEGKDGQLDFRHDNRTGVCFADGHVELVTPERAKTLKWEP